MYSLILSWTLTGSDFILFLIMLCVIISSFLRYFNPNQIRFKMNSVKPLTFSQRSTWSRSVCIIYANTTRGTSITPGASINISSPSVFTAF